MKISKEKITVKYQKAKEFCSCCNREFDIPEFGEVKEFDITLNDLVHWADWKNAEDVHDEDIAESVSEYIDDTIRFYALSSNEIFKVVDGEVNMVTNKLLEEVEKWKKK